MSRVVLDNEVLHSLAMICSETARLRDVRRSIEVNDFVHHFLLRLTLGCQVWIDEVTLKTKKHEDNVCSN